MPQATQPRASFAVQVTAADYRAAARIASRRHGRLHDIRWGLVLCLLLTAVVAVGCRYRPGLVLAVLAAGAAVCGGIVYLARRAVDKAATADYQTYAALFSSTTVTLWEDWMELAGPGITRKDPYALLAGLVETPELFVFLRSDGRFAVCPKRDMPADGGQVPDFLRNTFARKYTRVK